MNDNTEPVEDIAMTSNTPPLFDQEEEHPLVTSDLSIIEGTEIKDGELTVSQEPAQQQPQMVLPKNRAERRKLQFGTSVNSRTQRHKAPRVSLSRR